MSGRFSIAELWSHGSTDLGRWLSGHQRALHEIPEIAFQERKTGDYLARVLEQLELVPRREVGRTGLVAEIPGNPDGPTVLVRADMDGLPIEEDATHAPRSAHEGRMHACGHDGHMSIALGLAQVVTSARRQGLDPLPGRIVLLFQPAEEATGGTGASGAQTIVDEGWLGELGVDYVLGLHLWSYLDLNLAIVPDSTVMASSDEFVARFLGPGGHGALPHNARDVVLAASQCVVGLQSIVARDVDPLLPAVVSVGSLHAGQAANVLPQSAELSGTLRAPDLSTRELLRRRVGEVVRATADALGVGHELCFSGGYPPTVNEPSVARIVRACAREVLGEEKVADGPPTMASEDFSFFLQERPGAFFLLGTRDPTVGAVHPHHSPQFKISEQALPSGVEILLRSAVSLMDQHAR